MASESTGSEILDQYRNISHKLKKRFLRKPNVTEACESFTNLGQYCENEEMPSYAGLCWIAKARCEGSLGNITGEMSSLVRSARQFLSSETQDKDIGCITPFGENLHAALSCYTHAASKYPDTSPLKIGINLETSNALKRLGLDTHCEMYLKDAVKLSNGSLDTKIFCLQLLATNYIETGDYMSSLEAFTEISNLISNSPRNGARSDTLLHCEIAQVLLLLILRPAPQKLTAELANLLEKYTWGDSSDRNIITQGMSEDLFILLQSLVLTCQSTDTSTLPDLEGQLWGFLSTEEQNLLRTLVKIYHN